MHILPETGPGVHPPSIQPVEQIARAWFQRSAMEVDLRIADTDAVVFQGIPGKANEFVHSRGAIDQLPFPLQEFALQALLTVADEALSLAVAHADAAVERLGLPPQRLIRLPARLQKYRT